MPRRAPVAVVGTVLLHTGVAAGALALAIGPWRSVGASYGEGWGRQLVTAQVLRWMEGAAPWGHADLVAAPTGMPFWPVDPVVQLLAAPLAAVTDTATALLVSVGLLYAAAGLGPSLLARRLGAPALAAPVAGLLVQCSPFVLHNAADVVLEVLAFGPLAWVVAALHQGWQRPDRRTLLGLAVAVAVLAGTSPYYAVYAALGAAGMAVVRRPVRPLPLAAAGAVGCLLALGPLVGTESGPGGRLGQRSGDAGYTLIPGELVRWEAGRPQPVRRSDQTRLQDLRLRAPWPPLRDPVPGGLAVGIAGAVALARRRTRPLALLGLGFVVLGPGPGLVARALGLGTLPLGGLLGWLLEFLPLGAALGNPIRMLAPWILLASVCGAVGMRGRAGMGAGAVALAVAIAGAVPLLPLPASWVPGPLPPADVVPAGPMSVFPSGDPPWWHPAVGPKETLWIAAQMGTPTTGDYGRGREPIDRALLLAATTNSGVVVARDALHGGLPEAGSPWGEVASLLVLEDRLVDAERERLRTWLGHHAHPVWQGSRVSLWAPHPSGSVAPSP